MSLKTKANFKSAVVTANGTDYSVKELGPAIVLALAVSGFRSLIRRGIGKDTPDADIPNLLSGNFADIVSGAFTTRKAKESHAEERFLAVLAEMTGGQEQADALISRKRAALGEKFASWQGAVRRQDEFKSIYAAKFPKKTERKAKAKRVTVESLFA